MVSRAACSIGLALVVTLAALQAQQTQSYGAGVSLKDTTPLTQIIEKPANFEGKTVRVEGTVTAVCMHMGCWMALTPDNASDSKTMLIKVDDGVIVFPPSAKGRRAVAQGVVERIVEVVRHRKPRQSRRAAQVRALHPGSSRRLAHWCTEIGRFADWEIVRFKSLICESANLRICE